VASEYVEADKTSNCYDHEVMKLRSTKPKSTFPKLQNNEISKYTYIYQAVSYLDKTYGHHKFLTVVNKSGADQLGAYMKRFSKFGSKQDVDCLNTAKVKAHQWEGIPGASGSPHVCNEYPSAAFHCPTLAHFKCGPKTYDPLVRHFFSVFVTHNVDGNDVIFILSCR
jgi:hypothetical protein